MKKLLLSSTIAILFMVGVSNLFMSWMDRHPPTVPVASSPVASEAVTAPSSSVASEVTEEASQPIEVEFSLVSLAITDHSKVVFERPTNAVSVTAPNLNQTVQ